MKQKTKILLILSLFFLNSFCFLNDIDFQAIGFWKLGTDYQDSSFLKNHAELILSPPDQDMQTIEGVDKEANGALDFTLHEYAVKIPANKHYSNNQDMTFQIFIKGIEAGFHPNGKILDIDNDFGLSIHEITNHVLFHMCDFGVLIPNVFNKEWRLITIVIENNTRVKLYLDTQLIHDIEENSLSECKIQENSDIILGNYQLGGRPYEGYLDQFTIYNIPLSPSQIAKTFQTIIQEENCPQYCENCSQNDEQNTLTCNSCSFSWENKGDSCQCENSNQKYDDFNSNICQDKPVNAQIEADLFFPLSSGTEVFGKMSAEMLGMVMHNPEPPGAIFLGMGALKFSDPKYLTFTQDYTISFLLLIQNTNVEATILDVSPSDYLGIPRIKLYQKKLQFLTGSPDPLEMPLEDVFSGYISISYHKKSNTFQIVAGQTLQFNNVPCLQKRPSSNLEISLILGNSWTPSGGPGDSPFTGIITGLKFLLNKVNTSKQIMNELLIIQSQNTEFPIQCPSDCMVTCQPLQEPGRIGFTCSNCAGDKIPQDGHCICPPNTDHIFLNSIFDFSDYDKCYTNYGLVGFFDFYEPPLINDYSVKFSNMNDIFFLEVEEIKGSDRGDLLLKLNNDDGSPITLLYGYDYESTYEQNGTIYNSQIERLSEDYLALNMERGNVFFQIYPTDYLDFRYKDFSIAFYLKPKYRDMRYEETVFEVKNMIKLVKSDLLGLKLYVNDQEFLSEFKQVGKSDEWMSIVITKRDMHFLDLYIDSVLIVSTKMTQSEFVMPDFVFGSNLDMFSAGENSIVIENKESEKFGFFAGYLAEVRIYNKKLILEERQLLVSFPECPFFCPNCYSPYAEFVEEDVTYSIQCLETCPGNRIKNEIELCVCPEGTEDPQKTNNCTPIVQQSQEIDEVQAYLTFNDGIKDSSNKGNELDHENTVFTQDRQGSENKAISFENPDSFVKFEDNTIFNFENLPFTISFWVKADSTGNDWGTLIGNTPGKGLTVSRFKQTPHIRLSIAGTYIDIPDVLTNTWNFILIHKNDQNSVQIYKNNEKITEKPLLDTKMQSNLPLCLGQQCDGKFPFEGSLDEFRVVKNSQLTEEQRNSLYEFTCPSECKECDLSTQECLSCVGQNRQLQDGQCLCPPQHYKDQDSNCLLCPKNCSQCELQEGEIVCTICVDQVEEPENIIDLVNLRIKQNQCSCPEENYFDSGEQYCKLCLNSRCLTCLSSNSCTTCTGSTEQTILLRQQSPTCACPTGYYDDPSQPDCLPCSNAIKNCIECSKESDSALSCTKCEGDLVPSADQKTCECPKNYIPVAFNDPYNTECRLCPQEANCLGGSNLEMSNNYWRPDDTSTEILNCFNRPENCEGGAEGGPKGCKKGHTGALCEACDLEDTLGLGSYGNTRQFQCQSCDDIQIGKMIGLYLLKILVITIGLVGTLSLLQDRVQSKYLDTIFGSGKTNFENYSSSILKIALNFLFILYCVTQIRFPYPEEFVESAEILGNNTKELAFTFDCITKDMSGSIPNTYFRIIWQLVLFVIEILVIWFIGFIILKSKNNKGQLKTFLYSTIFLKFIWSYPEILTLTLESMACRQIGAESFIIGNTTIKCDDHSGYKNGFLLVLLIIWVLLIPLSIFLSLRKSSQKQLKNDSISSISTFFFLTSEYNSEYYYWELLKLIQKTLIAFSLAFYYNHQYQKAVIVLILIAIYLFHQNKAKPYQIPLHNQIDQLSQAIPAIILILGIFQEQNTLEYLEIIGEILMIAISILFFLYLIKHILNYSIQKSSQLKNAIKNAEKYLPEVSSKLQQLKKRIEQDPENPSLLEEQNTLQSLKNSLNSTLINSNSEEENEENQQENEQNLVENGEELEEKEKLNLDSQILSQKLKNSIKNSLKALNFGFLKSTNSPSESINSLIQKLENQKQQESPQFLSENNPETLKTQLKKAEIIQKIKQTILLKHLQPILKQKIQDYLENHHKNEQKDSQSEQNSSESDNSNNDDSLDSEEQEAKKQQKLKKQQEKLKKQQESLKKQQEQQQKQKQKEIEVEVIPKPPQKPQQQHTIPCDEEPHKIYQSSHFNQSHIGSLSNNININNINDISSSKIQNKSTINFLNKQEDELFYTSATQRTENQTTENNLMMVKTPNFFVTGHEKIGTYQETIADLGDSFSHQDSFTDQDNYQPIDLLNLKDQDRTYLEYKIGQYFRSEVQQKTHKLEQNLSNSLIQELLSSFQFFQRNEDQEIEVVDLIQCSNLLGLYLSQEDVKELVEIYKMESTQKDQEEEQDKEDKEKENENEKEKEELSVNFETFVLLVFIGQSSESQSNQLLSIFKHFNSDACGQMNEKDFKEMVQYFLKEKVQEELSNIVFNSISSLKQQKKSVSPQQFLNFLSLKL